jgi:putative MATE family efflux protein
MSEAASSHARAKFTSGPILGHVIAMTATGSVGLVAIFIVDALNLFYISRLGEQELAAAIGFAGTLQFFFMSVSIGLTIATSALVSRALGRGNRKDAASIGGASLFYMGITSLVMSAVAWPFLDFMVELLGAAGRTREIATHFLQIVIPSTPVMAIGMAASGILRGVGDAKRAMYVTLAGGLAAAVFDPLFIFSFDLGVTGAAIANVLSRFVIVAVGLHGALSVHRLVKLPDRTAAAAAFYPFFSIGVPAVLTQIATPVGNAYVTAEVARFGDDAVAGWAIIGRLVPVAFGAIFALSGAVGPIIGQNYGAGRYRRVSQTLRDSLALTVIYVILVWALIAFFNGQIAAIFDAKNEARDLVRFFCLFAAGSFLFNGALFVANAAFNNLGYATWSTVFNWGRSTLGTIPFVWLGGRLYGAEGVIGGWGLGAIVFGIASVFVCFRVLASIAKRSNGGEDGLPLPTPAEHSPFVSGKAAGLD